MSTLFTLNTFSAEWLISEKGLLGIFSSLFTDKSASTKEKEVMGNVKTEIIKNHIFLCTLQL